jgi:hypothetical protein
MDPLDVAGSPLNSTLPQPPAAFASLAEPAVFIKAPCANCARQVRSWPGLGRFLIAIESMVVVVFGLSRLKSPCCADTSTVWLEDSGWSEKFRATFRPTSTGVSSDVAAANPEPCTVTS